MDVRFYRLLREAQAEDFYDAINDPEDELYDVLWDLFEKVVIEPGEVFDEAFRDHNQFRFSIDASAVMEFFPHSDYYGGRAESNPYVDDGEAAGIHLRLVVHPEMSCLFSTELLVWGAAERKALQMLWFSHRELLALCLDRAKPMLSSLMPYPAVEHATTLAEALDNYCMVRDPENFLSFQYSFPLVDEAEAPTTFMTTMAMLYHAIRNLCEVGVDQLQELHIQLARHHAGRLPDLPHPLPRVAMHLATDTE